MDKYTKIIGSIYTLLILVPGIIFLVTRPTDGWDVLALVLFPMFAAMIIGFVYVTIIVFQVAKNGFLVFSTLKPIKVIVLLLSILPALAATAYIIQEVLNIQITPLSLIFVWITFQLIVYVTSRVIFSK